MTRPGFEPGPPRWEYGDKPPELWRGLCNLLEKHPSLAMRIFNSEELEFSAFNIGFKIINIYFNCAII
jgi:hypothetical protein